VTVGAARAVALFAGALLTLAARVSVAGPRDGEALRSAARHLMESQLPSGFLAYDFDFVTAAPTSKDNVARQAGVFAFLAEYYAETRDSRAREVVEAGLGALRRASVPISKGWTQSAVDTSRILLSPHGRDIVQRGLRRLGLLYRPYGDGRLVARDGDYATALSGATALALLAELRYAGATGDDRFRDAREAWLKGLLTLYIPGRGFRSAPAGVEQSPFSDGEAWLALAENARRYPGTEPAARLLPRLDAYLMTRYADDVASGFYQWGTMAAAVRFATTSDRRFLDFIAEQAAKLLQLLASEPSPPNSCALVEGFATALQILSRDRRYEAVVASIQRRVDTEMEKNHRLQLARDTRRITVADGTYLVSPHFGRFAGAFLAGQSRPFTRIDVTGHCLAALLRLERYGRRNEASDVTPGGLR
jgi:hypothetical protein